MERVFGDDELLRYCGGCWGCNGDWRSKNETFEKGEIGGGKIQWLAWYCILLDWVGCWDKNVVQ
jgi:hypothetical protein